MGGNKDCSPKKVSVLGQVSGILVRNTAPRVNNVIWAYPIGFNDANEQVYSLRIYNGAADRDWETLTFLGEQSL